MDGLAIDLELLLVIPYGMFIGVLVICARRAIQYFRMRTGGKW